MPQPQNWKDIFGQNAKFDKVDGDMAGIPGMFAQNYNPAGYQTRTAPAPQQDPRYQGTLAKVASALSGVVRGGMFGLLDPITKAVYPAGAKVLKESQAANPTESAAGELAGTVGSAFLNPASAGKAGIGALRAAIPGAKLLPMAVRNAVLTSTTAIPQAAGEIAQGEGVGKATGNFARNMAVGTVLGTAAEGVIGKLPGLLGKLKKITTNTAVREGLGIDPRSFKNAATIGGKVQGVAARERGAGLAEDLVSLMNNEGIHSEAEKEAWLAAQKLKWQGVDQAFDASGKKVSDFADQIAQHPTIQSVIQENPTGAQMVQDLVGVADKKSGIANIRDYLQRQADFAYKPGATIDIAERARAAKAIRETIDGAFVPPELKADYSKYKAIDNALTREDFRMPKTFSANSLTAGRLTGINLAQGFLGGAAGGASAGSPQEPGWAGRALGRTALGFAAGSLAPRVGSAIANKLTGRLAARIAPLIPEIAARTGEGTGGAIAKLAGRIGGGAEQAVAGPAATPAPTTPAEAQVQQQEAVSPPEHVAAAQEATNSAWGDTVRQKLDGLYDAYLSQYGDVITKDEFLQQAKELTNNFDPRKTAGFMFTDKTEKENYLRSYEAALRLQNLQKQYQGGNFVGEALGGSSPLDVLPLTQSRVLGTHKSIDEKVAYNQLRDWAVSLMTEQGKPAAKTTIDQVSKDLDTIINMRIPAERKRQLLIDHLANYGLNVEQLTKYGQLGGIA
jgi:hypothetical protein